MLLLHKALPLIVSPLGLVIGLLVLALVFRRRGATLITLLILIVSSLPLTADRVWIALESDYPPRPIDSVENADVIVVLSGMIGGIDTSRGVLPQWGSTVDRFFAGIDLLNAGKAPLIIFTRGKWPWLNLPPEGEVLANRALTMGIRSDQILLTGIATTTAEEALEVQTVMNFAGMERAILVTSAYHMQRAKTLFDNAGISIIPYATDFRSSGGHLDWLSFVPSAKGLEKTSSGIRELIGRLYYRITLYSRE